MTPTLSDLLESVKAADGPNRELDYAIDEWLWQTGGKHHGELERLPPFSASVDAALALVERLLPGWKYRLGHNDGGSFKALLKRPGDVFAVADNDARTLPLAILSALLTTLQAAPAAMENTDE